MHLLLLLFLFFFTQRELSGIVQSFCLGKQNFNLTFSLFTFFLQGVFPPHFCGVLYFPLSGPLLVQSVFISASSMKKKTWGGGIMSREEGGRPGSLKRETTELYVWVYILMCAAIFYCTSYPSLTGTPSPTPQNPCLLFHFNSRFSLLGTAVFPLKSTRALPWSSPAHSYSHCWYSQPSNTPLTLVHHVPQSPSHEFSHLSTSSPTFSFGITLNCHSSGCKKINEKGGVNKLFLLFIMSLITNFLSNFPFSQEVWCLLQYFQSGMLKTRERRMSILQCTTLLDSTLGENMWKCKCVKS